MRYFGLRTLKTGITVFLAVLLADWLAPGESFVIIFTSIVALENTVTDSYQSGLKRLINTAVGAVIAILMMYTGLPKEFTIPVAVMALIIVSNRVGLKGSVGISGAVLIIIMLATDRHPVMYSLVRLRDTSIGIATAVLVNMLIFPPKLKNRLMETLNQLKEERDILINKVFLYRVGDDFDKMRTLINLFSREINQLKDEMGFKRSVTDPELLIYRQLLMAYEKIYIYCENLSFMSHDIKITEENRKDIEEILKKEIVADAKDESENETREEVIYNYTLEKIIKNIRHIESYTRQLEDLTNTQPVKKQANV